MSLKNELVALAQACHSSEDLQKCKKALQQQLTRVIMNAGTYPKQMANEKQNRKNAIK